MVEEWRVKGDKNKSGREALGVGGRKIREFPLSALSGHLPFRRPRPLRKSEG